MENNYQSTAQQEELPPGFHTKRRPYNPTEDTRKAADELRKRIAAAQRGIGIGFENLTEAAEALYRRDLLRKDSVLHYALPLNIMPERGGLTHESTSLHAQQSPRDQYHTVSKVLHSSQNVVSLE